MDVVVVDDLQKMDRLKFNWGTVYAADPHAHIFLSWVWLRGFFEVTPYRWFVLALRPEACTFFVAFLPLAQANSKFNLLRILRMGGAPAADYTGLICLPEYEDEAIRHFAGYIQNVLVWDRFQASDVLDYRVDAIINAFSERKFSVQSKGELHCPYISLPESWDQYLGSLSRATRKSLKRNLRKIEALEDFRVTYATPENLKNQIEIFYKLWKERWGTRPFWYRKIFEHCFNDQKLLIIFLWDENIPFATTAAFVDPQKNIFYDFAGGYHLDYALYSPGNMVILYGIQYAIENQYKVYDFLRGGEEYKYSFGAVDRYCSQTLITRRSLRGSVVSFIVNVARKLRTKIL